MYDTNGEWYRDDVTEIKSEEIPYELTVNVAYAVSKTLPKSE